MKIKINISKRFLLRLAIFVAVIGLAKIVDIYFDQNNIEFEGIEKNADTASNNPESVFFVNQVNTINIKVSFQKSPTRKIVEHSQNKLHREYYQNRNFQVLKAEVQKQKSPLILAYHYLVFKNYFFTSPDDDPLS